MAKRQRIRKGLILVSFFLFPVTIFYFSPVLPIMAAMEGIVAGSLITFGIFFIVSLFLGRIFCGWLCPAGGLAEACFSVQDKQIKKGNWIKYLIWLPWISVILLLLIKSGGVSSVEPLFQIENGISINAPHTYIVYYSFLALIVILSLRAGKRSFCHHVCWMSPFMILGRKLGNIINWPSLRLKSRKEECIDCKLCDKNCPMSLNVSAMALKGNMENNECILCGACADICNKNVIHYSFSGKQNNGG